MASSGGSDITLQVPAAALPSVLAVFEEATRKLRAQAADAGKLPPVTLPTEKLNASMIGGASSEADTVAAERAAALVAQALSGGGNAMMHKPSSKPGGDGSAPSMATFRGRRRSFIGACEGHAGPVIEGLAASRRGSTRTSQLRAPNPADAARGGEANGSPTGARRAPPTAADPLGSMDTVWTAEKLIATTPHVRELLDDVKRDQRRAKDRAVRAAHRFWNRPTRVSLCCCAALLHLLLLTADGSIASRRACSSAR